MSNTMKLMKFKYLHNKSNPISYEQYYEINETLSSMKYKCCMPIRVLLYETHFLYMVIITCNEKLKLELQTVTSWVKETL